MNRRCLRLFTGPPRPPYDGVVHGHRAHRDIPGHRACAGHDGVDATLPLTIMTVMTTAPSTASIQQVGSDSSSD